MLNADIVLIPVLSLPSFLSCIEDDFPSATWIERDIPRLAL